MRIFDRAPRCEQSMTVMFLLVLVGCGDVIEPSNMIAPDLPTFAAAEYAPTSLGTLGGSVSGAWAGINNLGHAAGYSEGADGEVHAFFWTPEDGMVDLGTLGGTHSTAWGINDHDEVVGSSLDQDGLQHAFYWSRATGMVRLWGGTPSVNRANDINNDGVVVGRRSENGRSRAVRWTATEGLTELENLPYGGVHSDATAANEEGLVVGSFHTQAGDRHGFIWSPEDGFWDAGDVGGAAPLFYGINQSGTVVGYNLSYRAFVWNPFTGFMEWLDHPDAGGDVVALGINDLGAVAGSYGMRDFSTEPPSSVANAIVWTPGVGVTVLPSSSGQNSSVVGINNAGQAAGQMDGIATIWNLESRDPVSAADCRDGRWRDFGFRNQGQCIRFAQTGVDSR